MTGGGSWAWTERCPWRTLPKNGWLRCKIHVRFDHMTVHLGQAGLVEVCRISYASSPLLGTACSIAKARLVAQSETLKMSDPSRTFPACVQPSPSHTLASASQTSHTHGKECNRNKGILIIGVTSWPVWLPRVSSNARAQLRCPRLRHMFVEKADDGWLCESGSRSS